MPTEQQAQIFAFFDSTQYFNLFTKVIENTQSKPFKLKLGKSKLPDAVEASINSMKQGSRRLLVVSANKLQHLYSNLAPNSFVFYDITILRVRWIFVKIIILGIAKSIALAQRLKSLQKNKRKNSNNRVIQMKLFEVVRVRSTNKQVAK